VFLIDMQAGQAEILTIFVPRWAEGIKKWGKDTQMYL